ncbi:hypothetical protein PTKIN_Ptkin10aG0097900 [Pterospermum kingtungense]
MGMGHGSSEEEDSSSSSSDANTKPSRLSRFKRGLHLHHHILINAEMKFKDKWLACVSFGEQTSPTKVSDQRGNLWKGVDLLLPEYQYLRQIDYQRIISLGFARAIYLTFRHRDKFERSFLGYDSDGHEPGPDPCPYSPVWDRDHVTGPGIDDEVDDSDLEDNPFVAPLDNPIFDVFNEDDATMTTDPAFDEYDDEDEPIFDSYVKEDAKITYWPIFDEFDDEDAKIEVETLCDTFKKDVNKFIDIFSNELSNELDADVYEFHAVTIMEFSYCHDLSFVYKCFSFFMASIVDRLKGKIRGQILSNPKRMM